MLKQGYKPQEEERPRRAGQKQPKLKKHKESRIVLVSLTIVLVIIGAIIWAGYAKQEAKHKEVMDNLDQVVAEGNASIFPFNVRVSQISNGSVDYTSNISSLPDSFSGFDFSIENAHGKTMYLPKRTLTYDDFKTIIGYLSEAYGNYSYIYGDKYLWVSSDGGFELLAAYSEDLANHCAIFIDN